jgi:hypothetical protein
VQTALRTQGVAGRFRSRANRFADAAPRGLRTHRAQTSPTRALPALPADPLADPVAAEGVASRHATRRWLARRCRPPLRDARAPRVVDRGTAWAASCGRCRVSRTSTVGPRNPDMGSAPTQRAIPAWLGDRPRAAFGHSSAVDAATRSGSRVPTALAGRATPCERSRRPINASSRIGRSTRARLREPTGTRGSPRRTC